MKLRVLPSNINHENFKYFVTVFLNFRGVLEFGNGINMQGAIGNFENIRHVIPPRVKQLVNDSFNYSISNVPSVHDCLKDCLFNYSSYDTGGEYYLQLIGINASGTNCSVLTTFTSEDEVSDFFCQL